VYTVWITISVEVNIANLKNFNILFQVDAKKTKLDDKIKKESEIVPTSI
jgi:hypothetical protein